MNNANCTCKILIADGGDDDRIENLLIHNLNFPNLNYEYIKYPFDKTIDDYYRKLENVLKRVQTKYFIFADNDDFFILDKFNELVLKLESDSSYIGARGQLINLTLFDTNYNGISDHIGDFYIAVSKDSKSLNQIDPIERIETLCKNFSKFDYYTNWYCIYRTNEYKDFYSKLNSLPIKEVLVNEILVNVMVAFTGKVYITNDPYIVRQINSSMLGDKLMSGNSFLERCLTLDALTEINFSVNTFLDIDNPSKKRIFVAIAAWLEFFIYNNYYQNHHNKSIFSKTIKYIKKNRYLYKTIYSLYLKYKNILNKEYVTKIVCLPNIESYIIKKKSKFKK